MASPGVITLSSTQPGDVTTTTNPTFAWSPLPGAVDYFFNLTDLTANQHFSPLELISASYTIGTPLTEGDDYQWYVQAIDNSGNTGPESAMSDISIQPAAVSTPDARGPIGTVKLATPTLQWTSVPRAAGYDLYVINPAGEQVPGSPFSVQAPTGGGSGLISYTLPTALTQSGAYQFYVRALFTDNSLGQPGATAEFTISTASDLAGPPSPVSPSGLAASTQPTFFWMPVVNAAYYEIEVQDLTGGTISNVLDPTLVTGLSYTLNQTLAPGHSYQWLVAAFDSAGLESAWSAPMTFQVPVPPPVVTGVTVKYLKHKAISAITISFDEPLQSLSAASVEFYRVAREIKKGKKVRIAGSLRVALVSYNGQEARHGAPGKANERAVATPGLGRNPSPGREPGREDDIVVRGLK